MQTEVQRLLQATTVQARYDVCAKTLKRWLSQPDIRFPMPVSINGRNYWKADDLARWEAERAI